LTNSLGARPVLAALCAAARFRCPQTNIRAAPAARSSSALALGLQVLVTSTVPRRGRSRIRCWKARLTSPTSHRALATGISRTV